MAILDVTLETMPEIEDPDLHDGDQMVGLAPLVRVLRHPETLFGAPSERVPDSCGQSVDWSMAPGNIRRCLTHWGTSCTDVLFHLVLAAEVLRDHGVKICQGHPGVSFIWAEETMSVQIVLGIDATAKQAVDLTRELDRRAIAMELPYAGFTCCFLEGEGGDDEEDASFDPELSQPTSVTKEQAA